MPPPSRCAVNRAVAIVAAIIAMTTGTAAQSVSPMRGVVKSFADQFAVRVSVGNPYTKALTFDVRVYDENFAPVNAVIYPSSMKVGAGDTRQATIRILFNGQAQRKIRVCAEGLFGKEQTNLVRTQVCGRFLGLRLGY
jgi:P pilus assembly chaperone PapD